MKRTLILAALWAVMIGASSCSRPVEASASGKGQKWEYATLLSMKVVPLWTFNGPDSPMEAANGFELYKKLGGTKAKAGFTVSDALNKIGERGWELVSVNSDPGDTIYTFKRPG